jgi:hypothetical protein
MIWRIVSFAMAGIGAVLIVGTFTGARYAAFAGRTGIFLLGIALGVVTAGVASGLRRAPVALGCAGFGAVTVVVGAVVAAVVASVLPDVALSLAGAVLIGVFAALTCSVAYAVFDEGGPETVAPIAIANEAPVVGADEVQTT